MPLFFFLSGVTYKNNSGGSNKTFIKNKTKKLLTPYFIATVVAIGFTFCINDWRNQVNIKEVFRVLYKGHPQIFSNGPVWFLLALLISVSMYRIFSTWLDKKQNESDFVIMIVSILGMFSQKIWSIIIIKTLGIELLCRYPLKIDSAFCGLFFIALGHKLKNRLLNYNDEKKTYIMLIFGMAINLLCVGLNGVVNVANVQYSNWILFFAGAIAGCIVIFLLAKLLAKIKNIKWILMYIGRHSLIYLCSHMLVLKLTLMIINECSGNAWMLMGHDVPILIYFILFASAFFIGTIIVEIDNRVKEHLT